MKILLHAPMAGWAATLDEVPDAVFAERMMGEGLAIDPLEGLLRAPCDAEVITVPESRHAVTLRLANGAELLIHIGLETVGLGGAGFTAKVAAGQSVATGDPLIAFDLDLVARKAKSLISPIVLTGDGYDFVPLAIDRRVIAGEPIAEVTGEGSGADEAGSGAISTAEIVINAANGIHARPAARIAAMAKRFAAVAELEAAGNKANARSPVALMALGLRQGDQATLIARGADGDAAVAALAALIESLVERGTGRARARHRHRAGAAPGRLRGVCAAPGLAVGPTMQLRFEPAEVAEHGVGVEEERSALTGARAALSANLASRPGGIAEAHRALLDDPELLAAAEAEIAAGRSAGFAWRAASEAAAARLRATGNDLLIERIDDLVDVERQLLGKLGKLGGEAVAAAPPFPEGTTACGPSAASQMMALDLERVGGFCTARAGRPRMRPSWRPRPVCRCWSPPGPRCLRSPRKAGWSWMPAIAGSTPRPMPTRSARPSVVWMKNAACVRPKSRRRVPELLPGVRNR